MCASTNRSRRTQSTGYSVRDEFNKATRERLAQSAGYRCSKPDCGVVTRGADANAQGTIDLGVAAHITAAAPGGPRYDASLSPSQRRFYENGIWLCANHAKLVDSDTCHFTIEQLRDWKGRAERRSFLEIALSPEAPASVSTSERDLLAALDLLLDPARVDIDAFQNVPGWPDCSIALNLRMSDGDDSIDFTVSGLAAAVRTFDNMAVIAPPGTGKTTTLVQLTESIVAGGSSMALFLPLAEWATGSEDLFSSVRKRSAFKQTNTVSFELLARRGLLVLVLDGWNELDGPSRRRARSQVKSLRRDFPELHLVISSRHRNFDIPVDGPVVEISPLTQEQQLEIARSRRGTEGSSLVDHAWRTAGLRDLVAIPLYLSALLAQTPGATLPKTKEEVLRSFVEELEADSDKMAILRETLQGLHRSFMEAIAVEAMQLEAVALSQEQARAAINATQRRLKEEDQISGSLEPMKVVDELVSGHMLVRHGGQNEGVSFQHPQFQEWFASFCVGRLMLRAAQGDQQATRYLRETILDIPVWEEAILFACDRLSRSGRESAEAVAQVVSHTLGIDPLLAAQMIRRSSDDVWTLMGEHVVAFATKWYATGPRDRVRAFMMDTARAEFSEFFWPLISDPDNQVHLRALRAGGRFRPGVLGANGEVRIAGLPEDIRKNVVSEIAMNGDMDGIELATRLAANDSNSEVKLAVVESLLFRRANSLAKLILESAPDEVWRSLAGKWHYGEIDDQSISARIQLESERLDAEDSDPGRTLARLLSRRAGDPRDERKVRELVKRIDFAEEDQDKQWLLHRANEKYPEAIASALLSAVAEGKAPPYGTGEILRSSGMFVDDGPLVDSLLDETTPDGTAEAVAGVIGSKSISRLISRVRELRASILANGGRYDEALSDEYHRLLRLISRTKTELFARSVLDWSDANSPEDIALLADLISRHGSSVERDRLPLEPFWVDKLAAAVREWANHLLISPQAKRAHFATIAQAAERLGSPRLVPALQKLLSEDLVKRRRALEELSETRSQGRELRNDARMSWTLQYQRAFAAIGDDQTVEAMRAHLPSREFGFDAAHVLKSVWRRNEPQGDTEGMRPWPDYSVVPEQYKRRQAGAVNETHPLAESIFAVIDGLIGPGAELADWKHALRLATVAFSMPYANKEETIAVLLESPVPDAEKRDLLVTLVLAGEAISDDVVLCGVDELLEHARAKPWLLNEHDGWQLTEWLKLLAFTGRPTAILDVLPRAEGFQTEPSKMRGVLFALRYAPSIEAEAVLEGLAKGDERYLGEHEWLAALIARNSLLAARSLLNLICNASFTDKPIGGGRSVLAKNLATLMTSHDRFRRDVYDRFWELSEGPAKSALECTIAEAADAEGVVALVRSGAASGKHFRATQIGTALRTVLLGQSPTGSSGVWELYGVPAPKLRKAIFDLVVNGDASESQLATECLNAFDQMRDDYGRVDSEPRHPDISTGVPWPRIETGYPNE